MDLEDLGQLGVDGCDRTGHAVFDDPSDGCGLERQPRCKLRVVVHSRTGRKLTYHGRTLAHLLRPGKKVDQSPGSFRVLASAIDGELGATYGRGR
jgi:hypothetical protein